MRMLPTRLPSLPTGPKDVVLTRVRTKARIALPSGALSDYPSPVRLFHDGTFVQTRDPQPVGSLLKLELLLGNGLVVGALGEVVWIRLRGKDLDRPSGMAVRILFAEHRGRRVLAEDLPPDWWTRYGWDLAGRVAA